MMAPPPAVERGGGPSRTAAPLGGEDLAPSSSGAAAQRKREKKHPVWGFFSDGSFPWSETSRCRQAFCLPCVKATECYVPLQGRTDVLCKHIIGCKHVPLDHEAMTAARTGADMARKHHKRNCTGAVGATSEAGQVGSLYAHLVRPFTPRMTQEFEQYLLGVLLHCSIAFTILDSLPFRAFMMKWVSGLKAIPRRRAMSTTVLTRVLLAWAAVKSAAYANGVYVALSFDGCKSRGGRKLLGMLAGFVGKTDGTIGMDIRGTTDVTATAETALLVQEEIEREIQAAEKRQELLLPQPSGLPDDRCRSTIIALVSDSESANVGAKKVLSSLLPSLIIVACFAHQINLLTGFLVNNPSLGSAANNISLVVKFSPYLRSGWRS